MKKVKITGKKAMLTTDFGTLKPGEEYNVSDQMAAFLIKRNTAEYVDAPKKKAPAKKAASKK